MKEKDFTIYQTTHGVALQAHTPRAVVWAREALPPSAVPRLTRDFTADRGGMLSLGMIDPVDIVMILAEEGLEYDVVLGSDK